MSEENEECRIPPVSPEEILTDQEVISTGKRGDGCVKYEGYILFVPDCKKGDIISLKVERVLPAFGIGSKIEVENNE